MDCAGNISAPWRVNGLISNLASAGQLALVGSPGLPHAYNRDLNNFSPRFRLRLEPASRHRYSRRVRGPTTTTFRRTLLIANFTNSAGIVTNPIGLEAGCCPTTSTTTPSRDRAGSVLSSRNPRPVRLFVTPQNFDTPYVQSWNVNVQQSWAKPRGMESGYVGSKGTKSGSAARCQPARCLRQPPQSELRLHGRTGAHRQLDLQRPAGDAPSAECHGLTGFASYTSSKSLDDASDGIDFNFASAALPQNSYNLCCRARPFHLRHAPPLHRRSDYDVPQPWTVRTGWSTVGRSTPSRPCRVDVPSPSSTPTTPADSTAHSVELTISARTLTGIDPIFPTGIAGHGLPQSAGVPATGRRDLRKPGTQLNLWAGLLEHRPVAGQEHESRGHRQPAVSHRVLQRLQPPELRATRRNDHSGLNADGSLYDAAARRASSRRRPTLRRAIQGLAEVARASSRSEHASPSNFQLRGRS